jgi:hypothetical protein
MVLGPKNVDCGIPSAVNKRRFVTVCFLLTTFSVTGCQTDAQILAGEQEKATQTALRRGQFELDCPQATGTILSSNLLDRGRLGAYLQAEYTVGVAGCGQRRTYTVICRVSDSACATLPTYPLPK